jgi:hypothetical protein
MAGARKMWKGSAGRIGREICAELRSIIRQVIDLRQPLFQFELERDRSNGLPPSKKPKTLVMPPLSHTSLYLL